MKSHFVKPVLKVKLGWHALGFLLVLWALGIGLGLGTATCLTYHEAFVAQGAREIISSGRWSYPTIGGLPWLEKPPLPFWLIATLGQCGYEITPTIARLPSAAASLTLALGVGLLTARWYGPVVGILAAAVQITTAWTILRGRLAEADILLASLIAWTLLAFDRLRVAPIQDAQSQQHPPRWFESWQSWRWAFFSLLGSTSLVKGIGFGALLVLSVLVIVLIWDFNLPTVRRLCFPAGLLLAGFLSLSWPLAMVIEHGSKVTDLWALHVTQRISAPAGHGLFAGESWFEYGLNILGQGLPWTPLALVGAGRSLRCMFYQHRRVMLDASARLEWRSAFGYRLLFAWTLAPLILVSLVSTRNAHYAIHAMIPWSIWSALALVSLGSRLRVRGWSEARLKRLVIGALIALAASCGLGFWIAGPRLNHRGTEWAFYEAVGRRLALSEPLALLYDGWDRDPYPTPFGAIPHDLAVRLYYLHRPACWHFDIASLTCQTFRACSHRAPDKGRTSVVIVARERDLSALKKLGDFEIISRSQSTRWDRTYLLIRLWLDPEPPQISLKTEVSH